jgi:hypothetical protein
MGCPLNPNIRIRHKQGMDTLDSTFSVSSNFCLTLKFVLFFLVSGVLIEKKIFVTQNKPNTAQHKFNLQYNDLCARYALRSQHD